MPTPTFLTVDTELVWRHFAAGLSYDDIFARSIHPGGVGIAHKLARFGAYGLKATFFVDPMPALRFGLDTIRRMVEPVLAAGQEVQLHLHPNWAEARGRRLGFQLGELSALAQHDIIAGACELLAAAGAPQPVAFRAGSFAASDDTLDALLSLGFVYDCSHNGAATPWPCAIALPQRQIAPVVHRGMIELPVTLIEDRAGRYRPFQICALSIGEMRSAIDHALDEGHAALSIVSHSFELANRSGSNANAIHLRRFEALCEMLTENADRLPTQHFSDRPHLALGRGDTPLAPRTLRTTWRQAEQLWSNVFAERGERAA